MNSSLGCMSKQEWMLWDRIFATHLWETGDRFGSAAVNTFKAQLNTTIGSQVPGSTPDTKPSLTLEDRLIIAAKFADMAVAERRKRK